MPDTKYTLRDAQSKAIADTEYAILDGGIPDFVEHSFTIFTNRRGRLNKHYALGDDGAVVSHSSTNLADGTATIVHFVGLGTLEQILDGLTPRQAVSWGVPVNGKEVQRVVSRDRLEDTPDAITRTRAAFEWPTAPVLFLDFDTNQPLDKLLDDLFTAVPELKDAGYLARPSSGHGVRPAASPDATSGRGWHLYFLCKKGVSPAELGDQIAERLWYNEMGWADVSAAGAILMRLPVDTSVWQPERLDYAGRPVLDKGVVRDAPASRLVTGGLVDYLPEMSVADRDYIKRVKARARGAKEKKAREIRQAHVKKLSKRWNTPRKTLRRTYEEIASAIERGDPVYLPRWFRVRLDEGGEVEIETILRDPETYNGRTGADPLEPDYGGGVNKAILLLDNPSRPVIHSLAHGGITYLLNRSAGVALEQDIVYVEELGGFHNFRAGHHGVITAASLNHAYEWPEIERTNKDGELETVKIRPSEYHRVHGQSVLNLMWNPVGWDNDLDSLTTRTFYDELGRKMLNTYTPPPRPGARSDLPAWFLEHLEYTIPDEDERRVMLCFLADLVQHPERSGNFALLWRSMPGIGKDLALVPLKRWLGESFKSLNPDDQKQDWGDYYHRAHLVVLQEFANQGRFSINALKTKIASTADDVQMINMKGQGIVYQRRVARYIALTNYEQPIQHDKEDRRWFYIDSMSVEPRSADYYTRLAWSADREWREVIAGLYSYDLGDYNPMVLPFRSAGFVEATELTENSTVVSAINRLDEEGLLQETVRTRDVAELIREYYPNAARYLNPRTLAEDMKLAGWCRIPRGKRKSDILVWRDASGKLYKAVLWIRETDRDKYEKRMGSKVLKAYLKRNGEV